MFATCQVKVAFFLAAMSVALTARVCFASDERIIPASEISALLAGKTARWQVFLGPKEDQPYYISPRGVLFTSFPGGLTGRKTIRIDSNTNQFCFDQGGTCNDVVDRGNGTYGLVYRGQLYAVISNIVDGDVNDFERKFASSHGGLPPRVVFTGPNGKPLPGQGPVSDEERRRYFKKGIKFARKLIEDDIDFIARCNRAGGYARGDQCLVDTLR